jgi:hypothetical protein
MVAIDYGMHICSIYFFFSFPHNYEFIMLILQNDPRKLGSIPNYSLIVYICEFNLSMCVWQIA